MTAPPLGMRIEVRLFAGAREAVGASHVAVDLPAGATLGALAEALATAHPGLAAVGGVRFAVGERFAAPSTTLRPGDVVAVIPPVSGG